MGRYQAKAVLVVLTLVVVVWYVAAALLNHAAAQSLADEGASAWEVWQSTMALDRPLLPAPPQVFFEFFDSVFGQPVMSPRSLVFHAAVTAEAASVGFGLALLLGVALAVAIVHQKVLERSLMPWIIASQTIPILAIAPMLIVVLGNAGITGLLPKALIVGYLAFLPITVAMVTGLRAADRMQHDLMRTYSATPTQVFRKLRWPAAMPFLFPSLRIAAALALTGAIVAELPTGAQAGLGARLLAGSYYGQTSMIWAALAMAALLALLATGAVDVVQAMVLRRRGGRI